MELAIAKPTDIDAVLSLHRKYHIDSISEDDKKDGFVTTAFTKDQLFELIEKEQGLFVAKIDSTIVGYAMAASWQFWDRWPLFAHMIKQLSQFDYRGEKLSANNSYQYGPICIDTSVRGTGVLEKLFAFSLQAMSSRYPTLVTFINKTNLRSYSAHTRKLGLTVLTEFQFNNNNYYWLVCSTK